MFKRMLLCPKEESIMKDYQKRIMMYKSSLQIAKEWLEMGFISKPEFKKLSTILAEKYGLSLDSLFVE